jgi:hypothetical protein
MLGSLMSLAPQCGKKLLFQFHQQLIGFLAPVQGTGSSRFQDFWMFPKWQWSPSLGMFHDHVRQ